jgi:hypothetical protein
MFDPKTALKPCPFCGEAAAIEEIAAPKDLSDAVTFSPGYCTEGCIGYQLTQTFARRSDATEAWNARAV